MDERTELESLRRLAELEAKAAGSAPSSAPVPEEIDKTSGASLLARLGTGHIVEPDRKIAALETFYGKGNAKQLGDNYVVRDNGKLKLVNPEGLDLGDVAGSAREIVQGGVGIATSPATVTVAGAAVPAVASAVAGDVYDTMADKALNAYRSYQGMDPIPPRGLGDRAQGFGLEAGLGTVGGYAIGKPLQAAGGLLTPIKQSVVDAYERIGAKIPSIGAVTDSRAWQGLESGLSQLWSSAGKMDEAREAALNAVGGGLGQSASAVAAGRPGIVPAGSKMSKAIDPNMTEEGLGRYVLSKFDDAKTAFSDLAGKAEDKLSEYMGKTPVTLAKTRQWIADEAEKFRPSMGNNLPPTLISDAGKIWNDTAKASGFTKQMNAVIDDILADDAAGRLTFSSVKDARRILREKMKNGVVDTDSYRLGQLRDKLLEDMRGSIDNPNNLAAFDNYMNWYADGKNSINRLGKILGKNSDARDVGRLVNSPNLSSDDLIALERVLKQDTDGVKAAILQGMADARPGTAPLGGDISPRSLVTNANRRSPEVMGMLTEGNPAAQGALADTMTIADQLNAGSKFYNKSGTAQQMELLNTLRGAGSLALGGLGGGYGAKEGGYGGAAAGFAGGLLAPRAAAQFVTSPAVIKAMMNPTYRAAVQGLFGNVLPRSAAGGGLLTGRAME